MAQGWWTIPRAPSARRWAAAVRVLARGFVDWITGGWFSSGLAALKELGGQELLVDPSLPLPRELPSDSLLLRPQYRVVPFHPAREAELEALRRWCESGPDRSVRLLHGPGGMGKTRLAMELVARLRERGWQAGFLRSDDEARARKDDALRELLATRNTLVVLDYAETRIGFVRELLAALAASNAAPVRLLLLARGPGDWWPGLSAAGTNVQALLLGAQQVALGPLPDGPDERRRLFDEALAAFRKALRAARSVPAPPPHLTEPDYGRPLFLHLAALAALQGERPKDARHLLDWILVRERGAWQRALEAAGEPPRHLPVLAQAAALAVLAGGATDGAGLRRLVEAVPLARGLDAASAEAIARILTTLYPERPGLGVLKPDILGEELVAGELDRDHGLLAAALTEERSEAELVNAFTVLARLAARRPEQAPWLDAALALDPARLLAPALEAAKQFPEQLAGPLGRAWAGLPETERAALAPVLESRLPEHTVALRSFAVAVTQALLAGPASVPEEPERARILNNLSVRLAALGRREEALPAIEEAVALYRRLAARNPDAFEPDLATSLNTLSVRLAALGRRAEALAAIEEAVALYRRLAARNSAAFEPDLARSLSVLADRLEELGRTEEAIPCDEEALRTLLPHFLKLPQAHAELMRAIAGDYLRRCRALGRAPDAELLAPVDEVLARLGLDEEGD